MEILTDLPYEEIAQIFVRVNSGGRTLRTTDLAVATLSARWPGVLKKLEDEADRWAAQGWNEVDTTFLARALTGAVLGRGLSKWSHARLVEATDDQLQRGWATVQRRLNDLVPLVKNNLGISHSRLLPSMMVLLPSSSLANAPMSRCLRRPPTRSCTGCSPPPSATVTAALLTPPSARTSRPCERTIRSAR